jgi:hypothetical protein
LIRSATRRAHPFVVALFLACGIVQVFLAGLGVFSSPGAFITHREFGYLFGWLTLVALVLAIAAGEPRRVTGLSALLLGLFALQSVLVAFHHIAPVVAALHPLNGFLLLAVAAITVRESWAVRDGSPAADAARTAPVPSTAEAG